MKPLPFSVFYAITAVQILLLFVFSGCQPKTYSGTIRVKRSFACEMPEIKKLDSAPYFKGKSASGRLVISVERKLDEGQQEVVPNVPLVLKHADEIWAMSNSGEAGKWEITSLPAPGEYTIQVCNGNNWQTIDGIKVEENGPTFITVMVP